MMSSQIILNNAFKIAKIISEYILTEFFIHNWANIPLRETSYLTFVIFSLWLTLPFLPLSTYYNNGVLRTIITFIKVKYLIIFTIVLAEYAYIYITHVIYSLGNLVTDMYQFLQVGQEFMV